jgi:hypothetical protein
MSLLEHPLEPATLQRVADDQREAQHRHPVLGPARPGFLPVRTARPLGLGVHTFTLHRTLTGVQVFAELEIDGLGWA